MEPGEEPDPPAYLEKLDRFLSGKEQTTPYFELEKRGWAPPFAKGLADEALSRALTDLIWGSWDLGVMVEDCDHLSDRKLYLELLDYCDEATVVFPDEPGAWCHWSPIGGCSEEDIVIYHRFYSGEEDRADWGERYPEYEMPPMELPPYFRS